MYRQWIGLEHLGLHPNPELNYCWSSKSTINGVGPFTLSRNTEIKDSILVESPAWFAVSTVNSEGRTITVQGDRVDDPVRS